MARLTNIDSLYDFIGYVVLCAPDGFPQRDYLPPQEQMNLELAFEELRNGIDLGSRENPESDSSKLLSKLLDESFSLYKAGNELAAAHKLQDFQDAIFKRQ